MSSARLPSSSTCSASRDTVFFSRNASWCTKRAPLCARLCTCGVRRSPRFLRTPAKGWTCRALPSSCTTKTGRRSPTSNKWKEILYCASRPATPSGGDVSCCFWLCRDWLKFIFRGFKFVAFPALGMIETWIKKSHLPIYILCHLPTYIQTNHLIHFETS